MRETVSARRRTVVPDVKNVPAVTMVTPTANHVHAVWLEVSISTPVKRNASAR